MHAKCWKPEGTSPLRRPRSRWRDIIMDPREMRWDGEEWMHLAQDREQWRVVMNMVTNIWVP
jgi:hypothetical protein